MGERMKMKQEKAEALKQTILNVAYELFLTHGYEKVCLADIEQGAGASSTITEAKRPCSYSPRRSSSPTFSATPAPTRR